MVSLSSSSAVSSCFSLTSDLPRGAQSSPPGFVEATLKDSGRACQMLLGVRQKGWKQYGKTRRLNRISPSSAAQHLTGRPVLSYQCNWSVWQGQLLLLLQHSPNVKRKTTRLSTLGQAKFSFCFPV